MILRVLRVPRKDVHVLGGLNHATQLRFNNFVNQKTPLCFAQLTCLDPVRIHRENEFNRRWGAEVALSKSGEAISLEGVIDNWCDRVFKSFRWHRIRRFWSGFVGNHLWRVFSWHCSVLGTSNLHGYKWHRDVSPEIRLDCSQTAFQCKWLEVVNRCWHFPMRKRAKTLAEWRGIGCSSQAAQGCPDQTQL